MSKTVKQVIKLCHVIYLHSFWQLKKYFKNSFRRKMSTFGEIVEPGSRNTWEDWDENHSGQTADLKWQKDAPPPEKFQTLLLLEGRYLADSIKNQTELKLELINSIPEVNLRLYRTDSSDYVCVLKDYNLLHSSEIIELLKKYILLSQDVVAILTKPLVEYQVQELLPQAYVLRSLATREPLAKPLNVKFPKLEQPNIISGVSAGVISLREHMNKSGLAVVCYIEHPEEYNIDEIQQLLEKMNVITLESKVNNVLNSNLYI